MSRFCSRMGLVAGTICCALAGAVMAAGSASSEPAKKPRAQKASVTPTEFELRRSVFSGNEMRFAPLYYVNADCSSTPPDFRVVKPPANGEITFQEVSAIVELRKDAQRAHCNGKPAQGIAMFYKSNEDFTGQDRITVDIDFKTGVIRRYLVIVDVR